MKRLKHLKTKTKTFNLNFEVLLDEVNVFQINIVSTAKFLYIVFWRFWFRFCVIMVACIIVRDSYNIVIILNDNNNDNNNDRFLYSAFHKCVHALYNQWAAYAQWQQLTIMR
jgi:hypothetical protein